ncbi:ferredoxin [Actinotalea ferrariae CF5-4]|uniref:Cytochrome bc1 complex Rieske iron-sulfur subunit n=1 Tax=Actinotalea ferrariae CF5-4 TaxID=948458 RepID=A0A021VX94_9CELL|nr:Rieske (2Fe-2S) protein [Actinotalea ferrariae]EYR63702.1 ferredoxin [Actinotalea ferrariae CF5-4]
MSPTRRHVLAGAAGAAAGACLLAACGASGAESPSGASPEGGEDAGDGAGEGGGGGALTALADVPVGGAVLVTSASGLRVLVAQPAEGEVVAYSAVCTHQGCTVAPDGAELVCPCHGSVFDLATGDALQGPATGALAPFGVRVEGGDVLEA